MRQREEDVHVRFWCAWLGHFHLNRVGPYLERNSYCLVSAPYFTYTWTISRYIYIKTSKHISITILFILWNLYNVRNELISRKVNYYYSWMSFWNIDFFETIVLEWGYSWPWLYIIFSARKLQRIKLYNRIESADMTFIINTRGFDEDAGYLFLTYSSSSDKQLKSCPRNFRGSLVNISLKLAPRLSKEKDVATEFAVPNKSMVNKNA